MQARLVPPVAAAFACAFAIVLASGLVVPAAFSEDEGAPDERAALERVLDALAAHPPRTVREYRVAFRELGLVGESALPYMRALVRRYVDLPGMDDREAHAFLGDRHFHHPLPEEITFRAHPFLERVEAANAKEWFLPGEDEAWTAAEDALRRTRLHHRRLLEDHRYRAGDQTFANARTDPRFRDLELHFTWAEPYAVVQVGPRPPRSGELHAQIETLHRTYRSFLAEYGERLDLHDLMAPWGGRAGFGKGLRSFPDGAPLPVFLYADRRTFQKVALGAPYGLPIAAGDIEAWFSPAGALHVTGTNWLPESAVAQVLRWFARQKNKWGRTALGRSVLADGFAQWFAARLAGPEAERAHLDDLRRRAAAFRERELPYPVFPLEMLVSLDTDGAIAHYARSAGWPVPRRVAVQLYREQAWAFVRMLNEGPDDRHREACLEWMHAWLQRETQHGMARQVFERIFGIRDDDDREALDAVWRRHLEEIVGPEEKAGPPEPGPLDLTIGRIRVEGELRTQVILRDPDLEPDGKLLAQITLEPRRSRFDRFLRLVYHLRGADDLRTTTRPPVVLRHVPAQGPFPPWEDVWTILLALFSTGYEDLSFEGHALPEAQAFLDAWNQARTHAAR